MSSSANSWWIFALLSALFAAITATLAKMGVKGIDSDLATAIRTSVVLILVWGIAYFRGATNQFSTLSPQNYFFLVLSGLATGASWLFYFRALKVGQVSKVAPIDKLSVVFAIAFAILFLGEKPSLQTILGAFLIVLGAIVLIL